MVHLVYTAVHNIFIEILGGCEVFLAVAATVVSSISTMEVSASTVGAPASNMIALVLATAPDGVAPISTVMAAIAIRVGSACTFNIPLLQKHALFCRQLEAAIMSHGPRWSGLQVCGAPDLLQQLGAGGSRDAVAS